ncbi:hypothetical protein [Pelagibacterium luteolum]|uniref:Uncharacterized protein n=1 Tax=Pelagibacterium luteolum TaxID=440168 RepID=A0A1G7TIC0_9HYPH|nr:hypothetical protein [Pelagibacterium luteolum]SDG34290.1 hypothetical protein SAMN04487974_102111 [Pelagibacterium luteolum]SDH08703.1 hypothetical protein SAMN04487974_12047 [Pelagibacterium luteolum]
MTLKDDEPFSAIQLAQLKMVVREAVKEEMADAGLRIDDASHQDEAKEDFRFVRRLRKAVDGATGKIGAAVVLGLTSGVLWLIYQGIRIAVK